MANYEVSQFASDKTKSLWEQLQDQENAKPGDYSSNYQGTIDSLMDTIANRGAFSYDFNADPLYQQYKDQYTKLGNEAAMNAAASAASITGGYGSSYATTAAAQANQEYLTQLNNKIPELYNSALSAYDSETDRLNNLYTMYSDADETAYGRYRDTISDWQDLRDYYQEQYNSSVGEDQWEEEFKENSRQWQEEFDESKRQWQGEYDESRREWQEEFDKKYGDSSSSTSTTKKSSGGDDNTSEYSNENAASDSAFMGYRSYAATVSDPVTRSNYIKGLYKSGKISQQQAKELIDTFK